MPSHNVLMASPKRRTRKDSSPVSALWHDAFQESESPRASLDRYSRGSRTKHEEQLLVTQSTSHGTFLEDPTPVELGRNNEDGDDPHDLSLSPKYVARASMVDNMVLSLDQFSNGVVYSSSYNDSGAPDIHGSSARFDRRRGNTFSSSASSEGETHDENIWPHIQGSATRLGRRNSNAVHQKGLHSLPSIFGEDDEFMHSRAYAAQRAAPPAKGINKKHGRNGAKGSKGSTSSSVDLGNLPNVSSRLGPAGNRRSQSFDFGAKRRQDIVTSFANQIDTAPTPVVFAGPEAQNSPTSQSAQNPPLVRKNSTKSSKSVYGRKGRTGALGTTTIKSKCNDTTAPLPGTKSSPGINNVLPEYRPLGGSPTEISLSLKPGFFRRVFGSSRNASVTLEETPSQGFSGRHVSQGRSTPVTDENRVAGTPPNKLQKRASTEVSSGKDNQSTITKKSSAFFRRRKKSMSTSIPPPLPLTVNANVRSDGVQAGETSPVSSLRAFMDPFLADTRDDPTVFASASDEFRTGSNQGYQNARITTLAESQWEDQSLTSISPSKHRLRSESIPKLQIPDSKGSQMLHLPHQESFLVDSSSIEEPKKRSQRRSPPSFDQLGRDTYFVDCDDALSPKSSAPTPFDSRDSAPQCTRPQIPPRQYLAQRDDRPRTSALRPTTTTNISLITKPQLETSSEEHLKASSSPTLALGGVKASPRASGSDVSEYKSAPSTPLFVQNQDKKLIHSPVVHVSHPSLSGEATTADKDQARRIFDNQDENIGSYNAGAWLGEAGRDREWVRRAYMELFDWTGLNILSALRGLCDRIILKGETQQVDRILDAFAKRWCECNSNHGFKSSDVVHTICYSLLLLNTDLHLADIGQKMTRSQFVRNTLPTIKLVAQDVSFNDTVRSPSPSMKSPTFDLDSLPRRLSVEQDPGPTNGLGRQVDRLTREDSADLETVAGAFEPLVDAPYLGPAKGWESQIESVLKSFYTSISKQRLPLFGAPAEPAAPSPSSGNLLSMTGNMLRRTPSTVSKAQSDTLRGRPLVDSRSLGARWTSKTRSRPRLIHTAGFGSSRTSLDEQSSGWSPSMSSTWSKVSLGKTLTSISVDSFGSEGIRGDYQSSIGFANALSQAIIRDDQMEPPVEEGIKAAPLLEDESLELCGAPWAKEGILKHKCHLEGVDKRSKDRNWSDYFAVIEKGSMRLFSFSMNAKSLRQKAKNQKPGGVVGGGNWQENAEEVWKFTLRHTIASALPPPGYSKARPFVWALSLPTGAVHLFSVGTPDIIKEFVSTANYWSARLSKEPMVGGVSNMEYGWSDAVINRNAASESHPVFNTTSPRPSTQLSMRSSIDHSSGGVRPKLPGDKVYVNDWIPPQQSMMASQLMEIDQLKGLQTYVKNVEEDLQKHNEFRPAMLLAFSVRHPNSAKAMSNWEKKSSYLLREIVKFRTYIDTLQSAQGQKEKVYAMRREDEGNRRRLDDVALTAMEA